MLYFNIIKKNKHILYNMPIVAKNSVEYMLKKQQLLDDYDDYAKMRSIYKKSADSIRDNGTPFFQNMVEPKTTLEAYLDKSKTDQNLLTLLMNNLGANVGQAKQFIQHLDDSMKETLLDKFAGFEKIFEENFVSPKLNSLKGAFEIFIKEGIYDKKIINPSVEVITDWLDSLSQFNREFASNIITSANNKSGRIVIDAPTDANSILDQVRIYVRKFNSDVIGYSALYNLLERAGFPTTNLPKPTTTAEKGDTPSPNINTPITRIVPNTPDDVPFAPAMPMESVIAKYDEDRMTDLLDDNYKRTQLQIIARRYNVLLSGKSNQVDYPPKIKSVVYSKGYKDDIVRELVKRKYDPSVGANGEFLVFQQTKLPPFEKLGEAMRTASQSPTRIARKMPNFSQLNLPDPLGAEEVKGDGMCYRGKGIGMGIVFTK